MTSGIIILDMVIEFSDQSQTNQLCSSLTNSYLNQLLQANTPFSFGWGPNGTELTSPVKLTVGSVEFLLAYDATGQRVKLTGACNSMLSGNFSESGGDQLSYDDGSFQFIVESKLIDGTSINITVESTSNTSIDAKA